MKLIKKEVLDTPLYLDKAKKIIAKDRNNKLDLTVRKYFLEMLDMPNQKEPLTRDKLKAFNAVEDALNKKDFIIDDNYLEIFKHHIDAIGIVNRFAYEAVINALDNAKSHTA